MKTTEDFSYEIMAAVLVISFLLLLCAEYLWLYIISKKQEEENDKKTDINIHVHGMFEAVLNSPTDSAREKEADELVKYIGDDFDRLEEAATQLLQLNTRTQDLTEGKLRSLAYIYNSVNPIELYAKRLKTGSISIKGHSCRKLGEFGDMEHVEEIRNLQKSGNRQLTYNASMALSQLGDSEGVLYFAEKCESNHNYSHRILLELLQKYTGDHEEIERKLIESRDDYIKTIAIKAYSSEQIYGLTDLYIEYMSNKDPQLKIAAVKALSEFGDKPEFEHRLIMALNDKNWIVRLSAVNGLKKSGSKNALESLLVAVRDEDWWVRKAAAEAIVSKDKNLYYVEKILGGYDKYAADAVKNALYKDIKMNGGIKK